MTNTIPELKPTARYSINETARILSISRSSVYNYIKSGLIKAFYNAVNKQFVEGKEITRFFNSHI